MVVGDTVSAVVNTTNLVFTPAVGVQVVITTVFQDVASGGGRIKLTGAGGTCFCATGTAMAINPLNTKYIIDNTTYLQLGSASGPCGYTGIQSA
jgi:hypothetical protein